MNYGSDATRNREHEDGTPADPPVLHTAVPNWSAGDTIPLRSRGTLTWESCRRGRFCQTDELVRPLVVRRAGVDEVLRELPHPRVISTQLRALVDHALGHDAGQCSEGSPSDGRSDCQSLGP